MTDRGASIATDPSQSSYASNLVATHESGTPTDVLVGVKNDSTKPLTEMALSGPIIFEFDGDGLCNNASGAVPSGCVTPAGSTACGADKGPCSFPPPLGEPAGHTDFNEITGPPPFANGDVQNGYEGPLTWFSDVAPSPHNSGTVHFSPALNRGASTYFSLEDAPSLPWTTGLSTTQSAAGATGSTLYAPSRARVATQAVVLFGHLPTGTMTFQLFGRRGCAGRAVASGSRRLTAAAASSSSVVLGGPGTYRWRVSYSGDTANAPATTACGGDEIVVPRFGNVGLPVIRGCRSVLSARLHVRRRAAKWSLVFANGRLAGRFGGRIRIHVRRRVVIDVIASSRGAGVRRGAPSNTLVQQARIYRPCRNSEL
ncbi:MAG TPA: hypothetical protein VHW04_12960 [Solirubrobacteraceae bacterium]|nr:hypothetical protein [Solirubrobacteraceae bacterium]